MDNFYWLNYVYTKLKTMQLTDYQFVLIPKWSIKGFENYYLTTDKKLYHSKTNRLIKKVVKGGYSVGYVIEGKFITLKNLKSKIKKVNNQSNNNLINI